MSASRQFVMRFVLYAAFFFLAAAPVFSIQALAASAPASFELDGLESLVEPPQKKALLSVLYNASTYGELHPCPT